MVLPLPYNGFTLSLWVILPPAYLRAFGLPALGFGPALAAAALRLPGPLGTTFFFRSSGADAARPSSGTQLKHCMAHNITSADDSSTCADCRVGQYQDSPGSTACTSCDAGQYQGAVGKTYCDSCTVGWYQSQSGQSKCAACPEHSGSCKLEIQVRQDPPSTKTRPCL